MIEGLLQPSHLLLIAVVAVLFFGPSKIPELGKGIGEGIRSFKKGMKDATDAINAPETTAAETKASDTKV